MNHWLKKLFSCSHEPDENFDNTKNGARLAEFGPFLKLARGNGTSEEYQQVANWFRGEAGQGNSLAQFNLGIMYTLGQGVARDDAEAASWFLKAADQGNAGAQYQVGLAHQRASLGGMALNASESRIEAFKWFQLSAAQGYLGSSAASDQVVLKMSRTDVTDGHRRIAAFVPTNPAAC